MKLSGTMLLLAPAAIGLPGAAWGQTYAQRPIRRVVPFVTVAPACA